MKAILLILLASAQANAAALDAAYTIGAPQSQVSMADALLAAAKGQTVYKCEEHTLKASSNGVSFKKKPKADDNPFQVKK